MIHLIIANHERRHKAAYSFYSSKITLSDQTNSWLFMHCYWFVLNQRKLASDYAKNSIDVNVLCTLFFYFSLRGTKKGLKQISVCPALYFSTLLLSLCPSSLSWLPRMVFTWLKSCTFLYHNAYKWAEALGSGQVSLFHSKDYYYGTGVCIGWQAKGKTFFSSHQIFNPYDSWIMINTKNQNNYTVYFLSFPYVHAMRIGIYRACTGSGIIYATKMFFGLFWFYIILRPGQNMRGYSKTWVSELYQFVVCMAKSWYWCNSHNEQYEFLLALRIIGKTGYMKSKQVMSTMLVSQIIWFCQDQISTPEPLKL